MSPTALSKPTRSNPVPTTRRLPNVPRPFDRRRISLPDRALTIRSPSPSRSQSPTLSSWSAFPKPRLRRIGALVFQVPECASTTSASPLRPTRSAGPPSTTFPPELSAAIPVGGPDRAEPVAELVATDVRKHVALPAAGAAREQVRAAVVVVVAVAGDDVEAVPAAVDAHPGSESARPCARDQPERSGWVPSQQVVEPVAVEVTRADGLVVAPAAGHQLHPEAAAARAVEQPKPAGGRVPRGQVVAAVVVEVADGGDLVKAREHPGRSDARAEVAGAVARVDPRHSRWPPHGRTGRSCRRR